MENIFDNLFPITGKNNTESNKIIKLEMEISKLKMCLKMSNESNEKRKAAMAIMQKRLEEQEALIKRLHSVLHKQDMAMCNMRITMRNQQERLNHLARIDSRMDQLQDEQAQIIQFAEEYKQNIVN